MQSKKKNLLTAAVFIVCLGVGFGITRMLKLASEEAHAPEPVPEPEIDSIKFISQGDTIIQADTTLAKKTEGEHDAEGGDDVDISIRSDEATNVKKDARSVTEEKTKQSQYADNSAASSSGSHAADKNVITDEKPKVKPALMNKDDFEKLLRNTDDNTLEGVGSEKVSGHVRISVKGMRSDDPNRPSRVGGVRDKLSTGTWSSVRVLSVEADPNTGKIISATVEPIYP